MIVERKVLLEKLQVVSPALSTNEMIPVLTHFWLTGKDLMAFNDRIAISTPFQTEFRGAVQSSLLEWVKSVRFKTIKISPVDKGILVTGGKEDKDEKKSRYSRYDCPTLPPEDFIFEMPKASESAEFPVDANEFVAGLENCMRSVTSDTSVPDQLGVTLIPSDDKLLMFSTNDQTVCYSEVKLSGECAIQERVILSGTFCQQLLRLSKGDKLHLEIHPDHVLFKAAGTKIFGKLINSDNPVDFTSIIEYHLQNATKLFPIPERLKGILDRHIIVANSKIDRSSTAITIKDESMLFDSSSGSRGSMHDVLAVPGHPTLSTHLEPKLLKAGIDDFYLPKPVEEDELEVWSKRNGKFVVTKTCAIMRRGNLFYLVSANTE